MENNLKIGVIGLGYVGFPLACLFAQKYPVIGFDVRKERVDELNNETDSNARSKRTSDRFGLRKKECIVRMTRMNCYPVMLCRGCPHPRGRTA